MPNTTIEQNLTSIISSQQDIRAAIIEKGVAVPSNTPFAQYGNKIRDIGSGAPSGEWDDLISIWNTNKNANSRMLLVLSDILPTFVFDQSQLGNAGCTYRTSDGATYNANATHTWNTALDIPRDGRYIRWIIVDSPNPTVNCNNAVSGNNYAIFVYMANNSNVINFQFGYLQSEPFTIANFLLDALLTDGTVTQTWNNYALYALYLRNIDFRGLSVIPLAGITGGRMKYLNLDGITSIAQNGLRGMLFMHTLKITSTLTSINTTGSAEYTFQMLRSLQRIEIDNGWVFPSNANFSSTAFFSDSAAAELGTRLGVSPTARTLTFGAANLNRWSAQTKALFTSKNITLA